MTDWKTWLSTLTSGKSSGIDDNKCGIFTIAGQPCAVTPNFKITAGEVTDLVATIKSKNLGEGKKIEGTKFQCCQIIEEHTLCLQASGIGAAVCAGSSFVVIAMTQKDIKANQITNHVMKIATGLHPK